MERRSNEPSNNKRPFKLSVSFYEDSERDITYQQLQVRHVIENDSFNNLYDDQDEEGIIEEIKNQDGEGQINFRTVANQSEGLGANRPADEVSRQVPDEQNMREPDEQNMRELEEVNRQIQVEVNLLLIFFNLF